MSGWRTSFRRTSFVVQTKILYCETTIMHTISFWRQQLSQLVRKCASQNKAKNAGLSGKKSGNAGNTSKCGISRTIAGWLTPMTCGGGDSLNRNRELVVLTPLLSRGQHQWRVPQTLTHLRWRLPRMRAQLCLLLL